MTIALQKTERLNIACYNWNFQCRCCHSCAVRKGVSPKVKRCKPATKIDMEALQKDVKEYSSAYNYGRAKRMGCSTTCIYELVFMKL